MGKNKDEDEDLLKDFFKKIPSSPAGIITTSGGWGVGTTSGTVSYGPIPSIPSSAPPTSWKWDEIVRIPDKLEEELSKVLLICLPRGYGFLPDTRRSHSEHLAFKVGKINHSERVRVSVETMIHGPEPTVWVWRLEAGNYVWVGQLSEVKLLALEIVTQLDKMIEDEQDVEGAGSSSP